MTPHDISLPDARLHLAKLAAPFSKLENDAWLEIRALKEGKNGTAWPKPEKEPHVSALLSNTTADVVCMVDCQQAPKQLMV